MKTILGGKRNVASADARVAKQRTKEKHIGRVKEKRTFPPKRTTWQGESDWRFRKETSYNRDRRSPSRPRRSACCREGYAILIGEVRKGGRRRSSIYGESFKKKNKAPRSGLRGKGFTTREEKTTSREKGFKSGPKSISSSGRRNPGSSSPITGKKIPAGKKNHKEASLKGEGRSPCNKRKWERLTIGGRILF